MSGDEMSPSLAYRPRWCSLNRSKGVLLVHPHSFSILLFISFSEDEEKQEKKKPWNSGLRHLGMHLLNKNSLVHILTSSTALYMSGLRAKRREIALTIYSWLRIDFYSATNSAVYLNLTAHDMWTCVACCFKAEATKTLLTWELHNDSRLTAQNYSWPILTTKPPQYAVLSAAAICLHASSVYQVWISCHRLAFCRKRMTKKWSNCTKTMHGVRSRQSKSWVLTHDSTIFH